MGNSNLILEKLETDEAFWALREEWDHLLSASHYPNVFLSFEWLWPWWKNFKEGNLSLYTVREKGRLIGIFPLRKVIRKSLGLQVVALTSLTNYHSPRYDFIIEKGRVGEVVSAWFNEAAQKEVWDLLELVYVSEESEMTGHLEQKAGEHGLRMRRVEQSVSPYIDMRSDWETYLAGRSKGFREEVKYKERRLERSGKVVFEEIQTRDRLAEELENAFKIEALGWKGENRTAILCSENERRFYTEVALLAAAKGWFHLFFLNLDGEAIAFNYAIHYGETFNTMKIGFSPQFAKHSPVVVLRKRILETLFKEGGLERFDMLGTCAPWKMRWTKETLVTERIFVYRKGIRAFILFAVQFGLPDFLKRFSLIRKVWDWRKEKGGGKVHEHDSI